MVKETFFTTFEHPYVVINANAEVLEAKGDVGTYLAHERTTLNANIVKIAVTELQAALSAVVSNALQNNTAQKTRIVKFAVSGQPHLVRIIVKPLIKPPKATDLYAVIFEGFNSEDLAVFQGGWESAGNTKQAVSQNGSGPPPSANPVADETERKIAEREIALLMHNTEESFVLLDKDLRIVTFNEQFRKNYAKYLGGEISKGRNIIDFAPVERRSAIAAIYSNVLAGSVEESEIKMPEKNGHYKHFSIRYKPAYDEGSTIIGVFVTLTDITEQKIAELQLMASEKRYRALVENGGDAVVILSAEGKPTYVSPSVKRVLGYTEEEALQLDLFSIVDPADVEGVTVALNKAINNPGVPVEGHTARLRRKDGTWCYVEATLTNLLHDPDINGIVDNFRDVTGKKKAAEELKQTAYFLEKAQKVGRIGHWVSDPNVENGLLTWSRQTYKIFGVSEESFGGKTEDFFRLVHPDDAPMVTKAAKDAISGLQAYNVKHRIIRPDGSVRWVHQQAEITRGDNGNPLLMIGVAQDITDQVNWETDLKARNRFIETTIDNLPIGIAVISIDDGKAVLMNKKFCDIYGWPEEELSDTATFFRKVYPDEDLRKQTIKRIMEDVESRDPERMNWEGLVITTKKGKKKIVNAKSIPLYDQNVMISTVVDVTKQKRAEEALVQSEQKYKLLFESSPLPKWIYDEQTLHFLEVNQAAVNQYGYSREEFLRLRIDDIKLPEDLGKIREHVANVKEINNVRHFGSWRHRKKNGETILVETIGHRITYNGKPAMMILARDVTETVKAQQELKASNERFIYASKATSDAIWDQDIENNTIFWGDGYRTLFGYPLENHFVDASFWASKIHPEDRERIWGGIARARENKQVNAWSDQYRFQKADGSYAYVRERAVILRNNKGNPVRMIGALQDITESTLYEKRLVEDRNMLRAIIDNIPDHIFVKDLGLRQIISNKALYTEVFNLSSEEEMVGKTMLDFFEPEVAAMYEKDDRRVIATGEAIMNRLEYTVNRQGEKIWLSTTKVPLRNHLNEVTGLVGIARNITEKYLQEQELKQFSERLNNILESITDPFFALNNNWEFIYMNSAAEKQMGAGSGQLIGKNFREVSPGDSATPRMKEVFEKQMPVIFEIFNEPFNTWYEESIYPTSEGISVYFRNVSDRKLAEEHLQKAYKEKSNILESIKDGFYAVNRSWQITYWNKEAEVLLGKTRDEVVGVNIWEVFPDISGRQFYPIYHRVMKERSPESFEEYFENTNTWYELNVYPSEEGISVYFKDITEKQQAEEEIRIAKERYDMVAKVSKDAIYDWDIDRDNIAWGEGFHALFGHEWSEIESSVKKFADYVHPADDAVNSKRLQEVLNNPGESVWISEYRFRKSDGAYANILERGFIIRDKDGRAIRMIGSLQDITRRKQYEMKLEELNQQLAERAAQLAASNLELERFAYVASHDLQEPLRMITSFLQLLERKYNGQLDDKAREYIRYAVDGADRMKMLILDLLEYSRVNANTNEDEPARLVDLNEVGRHIAGTFSHEAKKEQVTVNIAKLPAVWGNREQLTRLFQNLLSNALKYHKPHQAPVVEMGASENVTEWIVWVKDNGIGIEAQFFDKIFIIFQRLHNKSEFSGTGIGLAICKKIVEKHGGKIWLESEVGRGSTFFVSFPKNQGSKTSAKLK